MKLKNKIICGLLTAIMIFALPQTVFADQDYTGYQWYLYGKSVVGEIHSPGINYGNYKLKSAVDSTPVVAVIDTGVDYTHPDLQNQMWTNPYPTVLKGTYGYDFAKNDADPMDEAGHGTHIAGIIAATQDDYGIDGIADAKIMALKVADGETVISDAVVEAFEYVYQAMKCGVNIKALNCSWSNMAGYSFKYQANYRDLIADYINKIGEMGALTVFAAGNDCEDCDVASYIPFNIDSPYTVVVGASDERDMPAYFSAYGKNKVDLYAPGTNILSTMNVGISVVSQQVLYANNFDGTKTSIAPYLLGDELKIRTAAELDIPCVYKSSVSYQVDPRDSNNTIMIMDVEKKNDVPEGCNQHEIDSAYLFVDVTDINIVAETGYILMLKTGMVRENGAVEWEMSPKTGRPTWYLGSKPAEDDLLIKKNGRTYLRIIGVADTRFEREKHTDGKASFCFDDFILVREDWVTSLAEKYGYNNGTSMATPMVSGAIALLSTSNPKANAIQIREALMKSVRKIEGLDEFCKTGGILDLANALKPNTNYKTLKFTKSTRTMSYQKYWGEWIPLATKAVGKGSEVSPSVTYTSSNNKYASVNKKGKILVKKAGRGHTVTITVKTNNGTKNVTSKIKIKITK